METCVVLSKISEKVSEYYDEGYEIKVAIEKAARFFNRTINLDRQLGPVRIINDCNGYGVTDLTTLRTALSMIHGTRGGLAITKPSGQLELALQ